MTYEQRKQERQALIDHLLAQDWNVFGTLKFVNGRTIGVAALINSCAATGTALIVCSLAKLLNARTCAYRAGALHTKAQTARTTTSTLRCRLRSLTWITCAVCSTQCGRSTMLKQRHWRRTGSFLFKIAPQWPVTLHTNTGAWAVTRC